jgi:hypothetical protein
MRRKLMNRLITFLISFFTVVAAASLASNRTLVGELLLGDPCACSAATELSGVDPKVWTGGC